MLLQDIQTNRVLGPFQAVIAPEGFEHLIKKYNFFTIFQGDIGNPGMESSTLANQ